MAIIHMYPQTDGHYTHVPWGKKALFHTVNDSRQAATMISDLRSLVRWSSMVEVMVACGGDTASTSFVTVCAHWHS